MKVTQNHIFFVIIILFSLYCYSTYKEKFVLTSITAPKQKQQQIIENVKSLKETQYLNDTIDSDDILNRYINKHLLSGTANNITPDISNKLNNETLKALQLIELNELKLILKRIHEIETLPIQNKVKKINK